MGRENQVTLEIGTSTSRIRTVYWYVNTNITEKPSFKSNITKLKDDIFTQGLPYDTAKYEDSIETLVNYFQTKYSAGVYLVQTTQEGKLLYLIILIKPNKDNNQSDAEFCI